ncbi:MAG TPA: response regulator [Rhodocyclaceae bacterium]|nr:response regulator [Rhodocyclaceae bacterium]
MSHRILLVDDEPGVLNALRRLLMLTPCAFNGQRFRLQVDTFGDPAAALRAAGHTAYELVISDYRMPGMDGVQLLKGVRELQPRAVRFILSGYADLEALIGAINEAQISRFIGKPWNDYELVAAIAQGLAYRALQVETERLADERRIERQLATPEDIARKQLEAEEPGITRVRWGPDGSVILDPDLQAEYERMNPHG